MASSLSWVVPHSGRRWLELASGVVNRLQACSGGESQPAPADMQCNSQQAASRTRRQVPAASAPASEGDSRGPRPAGSGSRNHGDGGGRRRRSLRQAGNGPSRVHPTAERFKETTGQALPSLPAVGPLTLHLREEAGEGAAAFIFKGNPCRLRAPRAEM